MTTNEFYGRPADGLNIRDPRRGFQHVPKEPRSYPMTDYWVRRFGCGDMVEVPRQSPVSPKSAKVSASKTSD